MIFIFGNYFAKLCYAFEDRLFLSAIIVYEKRHSKLFENEPENIP